MNGKVESSQEIMVGKPLFLTIIYNNTGHEPARNFTAADNMSRTVNLPEEGWRSVIIEENKTCETVEPSVGGASLFPSETVGHEAHFFTKEVITDDIATGKVGLYMQGCFHYDTFGEHHKSAFCFYLDTRKDTNPKNWLFKFCPKGNYAD